MVPRNLIATLDTKPGCQDEVRAVFSDFSERSSILLANLLHVVRTLVSQTANESRDEGKSAADGAKKCRFTISVNNERSSDL